MTDHTKLTDSGGRLTHVSPSGAVVSANAEHMAAVLAIESRGQCERESWIAELKSAGVKAAHPDDGWVKRTDDPHVHLEYPYFNLGLDVGDLLALGWPWSETRIVRVTRVGESYPLCGLRYWYFEEVETWPSPRKPQPAPREKKRRFRRLLGLANPPHGGGRA